MTNILEVKNLNVKFQNQKKTTHAVRGIDFVLKKGEFLGIVGESGCGKSAAIKAILNLLPFEVSKRSGEIWYQDQNLADLTETQMQEVRGKEIGMLFQDASAALNPILKIGIQMIEGYRKHFKTVSLKEANETAIRMLHKVGMPRPEEVMQSYPHALSIGMRQRVMMALTLICKPKILLADEPTTGLDAVLQSKVMDFLKQLQAEEGISTILITHDLNLAGSLCDRIMVMYAGKIVEVANADELFNQPLHPYSKGLMHAMPPLEQNRKQPLVPIQGSPPDLTLPLNYCSFCSRCPEAMNICASRTPLLIQVSKSRQCACFNNHS